MRFPIPIPAAGSGRFDVVGFGLNSVDLVAVVAEYPRSNTKQRLQRFARLPGGQTATTLATCARLGLRCRYVGTFGDDDLGALARRTLVDHGVDVSAARTVPGATNQFAVILVDGRTGERTVLWDRDPSLAVDPIDVPRDIVADARMLVVDCHETAAASRVTQYAREAGVPTVLDVEKIRPGLNELLQNIDVIIAAQDFPTAYTGYEDIGRAIEAIAREFNTRLVCVTLGASGSLAWCNGREFRTPAFPVDCVDSTGAGDAFRGGFAVACLCMPHADVEDILRFANAVGALNCRALGAQGGLPTLDEVEPLLMARPRM